MVLSFAGNRSGISLRVAVAAMRKHLTLGVVLAALAFAAPVLGQGPDNLLLVLNEATPVSLEVGQYYTQKHGIPAANVLRIKTGLEDAISRDDFTRQIEGPIAAFLARNSLQDRILYIVLTKGIPLRVEGTSGPDGTVASVDSELTLLYRKMVGQTVTPAGRIANPYFLRDAPIAQARAFTHEAQDIFLVSRLDGYTSADIRALIDRGCTPANHGKILLDQKEPLQAKGNNWLRAAADILKSMRFPDPVVLETSAEVLAGEKQVLGYCSWGSNDPAIRRRHFGLEFVPGALSAMFVSSDGRTFQEPPASWNIGTWEDKTSYFAGSPQSMAGDLIREGVTGVAAHVSEPYLEATIRPDILFPAYLSGFNLIESYYLAMPFLSWQTVVIGDPLCAPFRQDVLGAQEIEKGIDPDTELPKIFSTRRLAAVSVAAYKRSGMQPDTVKLLLRAEARNAKGDTAGARKALEEATARDGRIIPAEFQLAVMYEQSAEYDKAIARYRRLIELAPDNPSFLNNLAYALAVRKNEVQEAVPLAEKAYGLGKGSPSIADTLGWIYHLQGDDRKALPLLEEALSGSPANAEINLHAASIYAALGQTSAANQKLLKALELDPQLDRSPEVQALRKKLQK